MNVVLSIESRSRIYHRGNCPYARRITCEHREVLKERRAIKHHYRPCSCCGGLQGFYRVTYRKKGGKEVTYDKVTDTLYLRTETGFWKIFQKEDCGYLLYHRNVFEAEKTTRELMHGSFHRQSDVSPTDSVEKLLSYAREHDRAKQIIAVDYRNLPRRTEKQKRYYKIAEKRARRERLARLDQLFDMLEKTGNCRASELCG